MKGTVWALVLGAPLGCIDHGLNKEHDGEGLLDPPEIEVLPTALDFGDLGPGESTQRRFTILNEGSVGSLLEVDRVELVGDSPFSFVTLPDGAFGLEQGESTEVVVMFAPDEPEPSEAVARIHSNDEDESIVEVDLVGSGLIPILQISPDPLEVGTIPVGCGVGAELTLLNAGNDTLEVSSISLDGTGFSLLDVPDLPTHVGPGRTEQLSLSFVPAVAGDYDGVLTVHSNEEGGVRIATQHGAGRDLERYRDEFTVDVDPSVDVLFYVDQSWSMEDDQAALGDNFQRFIDRLAVVTPDWQVMVVTEDDGCTRYPILTPTTLDWRTTFLLAVTQGEGGLLTEAGLSVVANALERTGDRACNDGFLRPDSYVHVILVSDEPEQSPDPWDTYVARMDAATVEATSFKISAVAGDFPGGCETASNSARAGSGYWEAVVATGGTFLSICSDWSIHADTLADETVVRDTFGLRNTPDLPTLTVTVNGVVRTDWVYEAPANAVVFNAGSAPTAGDTVVLEYDEPLVCP